MRLVNERFAAERITHAYATDVVLHQATFTITRGRVTGLVGENGSGKSTLIRIMTGALTPTSGTLLVDGAPVALPAPADAQQHGIAVVHQDYNLVNDLSVAENMYALAHTLPRRGPLRLVDRRAIHDRVRSLLGEFDISIAPGRLVRTLDAVERKFVEIARALVVRPRFLILDEPTASLEPAASGRLLELIGRLRDAGTGIALVSHRLDEIVRAADDVTVLRDGRVVAAVAAADVDERRLAYLMSETEIGRRRVGRPAAAASASGDGAPAVRLQGVRLTASAPPLDLDVGHGEIVGLTGLLGSGATTLLGMLGGAAALPGAVEIGGQAVRIRQPLDARAAGIGYIAEDRKGQGLILDQTVAENIALASLERTSRGPLLNRRAIDDQARRYADELDIRMPSIHAPVSSLSGGNQQKVLIARWLASGVRVLVIDEPTHGVDIAGKLQIHALLRTYAQQGGAVLIASTDVDEILALCDRVGVMRHGALASLQSTEALSHLDVAVLGVEEAAA